MILRSIASLQRAACSAIWVRIVYVCPQSHFELRIGDYVADGLVITEDLMTGFIPPAALKAQGTQPVSVMDTNTGSCVHVGFLTIAGKA